MLPPVQSRKRVLADAEEEHRRLTWARVLRLHDHWFRRMRASMLPPSKTSLKALSRWLVVVSVFIQVGNQ